MGKSGKICQYRERLDKTLAAPELTNIDALKTLIRKQILHSSPNEYEGCSENVIEKRTTEVSHFLDMLRSASVSENKVSKTTEGSHGEWKLKDDNEDYRVMYRQGLEGSPFHTLLVEGYVDGPVDSCLCISWESNMYQKWWPQYSFPPFKITICKCLQKIRIGEQISLVRVKVTWPLSAREAVVHYFLFEYLQDGLIVVILNTISDLEGVDRSTHGFTKDGIPEPKDVVRIDVVGGFALQKMSSERSYFRTIANIDLKLDFVPPSLINFISRQLIGSGFRVYQKVVTSLLKYDEDYSKALEDPLYARIREALYPTDEPEGTIREALYSIDEPDGTIREAPYSTDEPDGTIREALYSTDEPDGTIEKKELKDDVCLFAQRQYSIKVVQKTKDDVEVINNGYDEAGKTFPENLQILPQTAISEIMEETIEESRHLRDELRLRKQEVHRETVEINAVTAERKIFNEIEEEEKEDIGLESGCSGMGQPATNESTQDRIVNHERSIVISAEVEQALETLEKAISVVRKRGCDARPLPSLINEDTRYRGKITEKDPSLLEASEVCSNEVSIEASRQGRIAESTSHESRNSSSSRGIRRAGSNASTREVNHNRIAPASPEHYLSPPSTKTGVADVPIKDLSTQGNKQISTEEIGSGEDVFPERKKLGWQEKLKFCCFTANEALRWRERRKQQK